jgi:hypothetical protein
LLWALSAFFISPDPETSALVAFALLANLVALFASLILVGRWIYRTNANAHSFSDAVTITPGWSIGWFFVPFANLIKPYEGVKETWIASHQAAAHYEEIESPLPALWWGLWIATNIASTASSRIGAMTDEPVPVLLGFDILVSGVNVMLCVVLIQLMRRLSRTQIAASHGNVFA